MARSTWAVGDIQGCFAVFERLLRHIAFDPEQDRLWLAGDLINRGPGSLEMLRWAVAHDHCVTAVLGNHDLHLLGCARGFRRVKGTDTIQPLLDAPDRDALLTWLRHRPLMVREGEWVMLHAGLAPDWTLELAMELAGEIEATLQSDNADRLLSRMRGSTPRWTPALTGIERQAAAIAVLTRMRACNRSGAVTKHVGPPEECPEGEQPWYAWRTRPGRILFGHWAAHGHRVTPSTISLDSGALWGGVLTAYRLEDGTSVDVPGLVVTAPFETSSR